MKGTDLKRCSMNKMLKKSITALVAASALAFTASSGGMHVMGDEAATSSYFAMYCEEVAESDIVQLKKDSAAYKSIKKFLYDIACNTPYVSGRTDCSGEVTRALCYGLGGVSASSYHNTVTIDDLVNVTKEELSKSYAYAAYIYLDGKLVNGPSSYYNYLINLADGTEVTLSSYDGTCAKYKKYYVDSIPKTADTAEDIAKAKKVFDALKHPGTIGLLASGKIGATAIKGHMWLSLGAFPTGYSADDIAAYLNEEYLTGTGVQLGSEASTQDGINWRYEVNLFPGVWGCTSNILRCSSNTPAAGMEVNNQFSGFENWGELLVLIPVEAETGDQNDITTREKPATFGISAPVDPVFADNRYELLYDGVRYFGKQSGAGSIIWYSDYEMTCLPFNALRGGMELEIRNGGTAVITIYSGTGYGNEKQLSIPVVGECVVKIENEGAAFCTAGSSVRREREEMTPGDGY